jgi:hypothetical protein
MQFPLLTVADGAVLSLNPAHIIDIKPYGYNNAPNEPMPAPNGIQTKIVWRWPGGIDQFTGEDLPPMITQTYCKESVLQVIAQLNV